MAPINRRGFLKSGLALSAMAFGPVHILKSGESANKKLNVAVIGLGGQGTDNARMLTQTDNVIALCDVDADWCAKHAGKCAELKDLKLWTDYREMFDKIGKDIDAVCIATPEHVHYTIATFFIRRGKHVYCQKPLCHTVNEVRMLMAEAQKQPKVVTQMGHQGHSTESSAIMRDWALADTIGPIREVHAYSRKNYWVEKAPEPPSEPPKTLNWDLYLNRAEAIPFSTSYMNREWIKYSHFSGAVGDMGAHILDPGYYMLDLRVPSSVQAEVPVPAFPGSLPKAGVITWEFPARGDKPPVTMKYYLGPGIEFPWPRDLEKGRRGIDSGSVMVGEKASVMAGSHSQGARIIPEKVMQTLPRPEKKAPRCKGKNHFQNFTLACKGEDTALSSFDYAGPLSEIIVLGDVALLNPGRKLLWDSEKMRITNDEEADKSLFMRRLAPRDDMNWI